MKRKSLVQQAALYSSLLVGVFFSCIPLFWLIRSSLMTLSELYIYPPLFWPQTNRWQNYYDAMTVANFPLFIQNTISILIPVMFGTLITSALAAYGFARIRFPYKNIWFAAVISSLLLPYAVTMIPTFIMWSRFGAINTFYPLWVPAWFGGGAFNIFLLRQFFLSIPNEIEDAAVLDGANHFDVFWRIMLPLVRPGLIVIGIFTFLNVWNDFLNPLLYLNDEEKFTVALGLNTFKGTYATDWHLLMAASAIVVIPPIIVFFIGQRYFLESATLSGMKL